jgi:predicted PurR-regulated permease PerM
MNIEKKVEPAPAPRRTKLAFAAQELRLISALVVLMAIGLFLALPFVLSIGSVVFLPVVTAIIITIVLAPMADKMANWGVPNVLSAFISIATLIAILALALGLILQPALSLMVDIPNVLDNIGEQFVHLRGSLAWVTELNRELAELIGQSPGRQVVVAEPTFIEEIAIATPSLVLEVLLTFLMAFFMMTARVRHRRAFQPGPGQSRVNDRTAQVLHNVQDKVSDYILTVGVINLGVGIVVAGGAWAIGLEAPIMWGGLAAMLNFLPYIGPMVMIGLLALVGLGTSETILVGLIPAAAYLGLHTIESNVVTPSILGARFTMNPVLILIALSYFTWIWGVTGALLSVPILLTLTALIENLGKPNLTGFVFGEPLFSSNLLEIDPDPADGDSEQA